MPAGCASLASFNKNDSGGGSGPPFPAGSANNGLSVNGAGVIVWGNDVGDVAQPAQLLSPREIDFGQFNSMRYTRPVDGAFQTEDFAGSRIYADLSVLPATAEFSENASGWQVINTASGFRSIGSAQSLQIIEIATSNTADLRPDSFELITGTGDPIMHLDTVLLRFFQPANTIDIGNNNGTYRVRTNGGATRLTIAQDGTFTAIADNNNRIVLDGNTETFTILSGGDPIFNTDFSVSAFVEFGDLAGTGGNTRFELDDAGNRVTVTGAQGLRITNDPNNLIHTGTTLTDYAAAAVATLNNAPVAGDPTKWIAIDDNGAQRWIPTWDAPL